MFLRACLCVSAFALSGACLSAFGQNSCQRCTTSTMDGEWAFSCSGVAPNPYTMTSPSDTPLVQPFAMNGVFSVHKGHIEGPSTSSFNGQLTETFATTSGGDPLVLKSDCTGGVTYQVSMPGFGTSPMPFRVVLFNNSNEGFGMPTNPGMVVTCHIVRIHR
jgi:hypothetical protein